MEKALVLRIQADEAQLRRLIGLVNQLDASVEEVNDQSEQAGGGLSSMGTKIGAISGVVSAVTTQLLDMAAAGSRAVSALASSFIDAASEVEQYRIRLTAVMRSQEEGQKLFDLAEQWALKLPFELREVMSSMATLSTVVKGGAEDVARFIPLIGDIATVAGLSFEDTAQNVARMWAAGTGAADQFRDKGTLAMLGFQHGAEYSIQQVRDKLWEAWNSSESIIRDASARMAESWMGLMSMLADSWFKFRTTVMEQGVFEALKGISETMVELSSSPEVIALAEQLGDSLTELVESGTLLDALVGGFEALVGVTGFLIDHFDELVLLFKFTIAYNIGGWALTAANGLSLLGRAGTAAAVGLNAIAPWVAVGTGVYLVLDHLIDRSAKTSERYIELATSSDRWREASEELREEVGALNETFNLVAFQNAQRAYFEIEEEIEKISRLAERERAKMVELDEPLLNRFGGAGPVLQARNMARQNEAREHEERARELEDETRALEARQKFLVANAAAMWDATKASKAMTEADRDAAAATVDELAVKEERHRQVVAEINLRQQLIDMAAENAALAEAYREGMRGEAVDTEKAAEALRSYSEVMERHELAVKAGVDSYDQLSAANQARVDQLVTETRLQLELNAAIAASAGIDFETFQHWRTRRETPLGVGGPTAGGEALLPGIPEFIDPSTVEEGQEAWDDLWESTLAGMQETIAQGEQFMQRQKEAASAVAEAWFRTAQIMGDAFGEAFGEWGSQIEQIVNGIFQVIGLIQQAMEMTRALSAAQGAGGGGGFFSSLFGGGLFGGGGRGGGGGGFVGPPASQSGAAAYFREGGWMGGGGGGGFSGWSTTGQGALMGLGIGAGIGGVGSQLGLGGYASEGGAVGGAIGGAIAAAFTGGLGGPAGAAIGGAIGTVVGSLINKGADEARGLIEGGSFRLTASEGKTGQVLRDIAADIMEGVRGFTSKIGGTLTAMGGVGLTFREGEGYRVWGGGSAADAGRGTFRTEDAAAAMEEALFRAIRQTSWDDISENIVAAIHSPLSQDLASLSHNVEVALALDNLGGSTDRLASSMREVLEALRLLEEEGERIGLDTSNAHRARIDLFREQHDELLGIERTQQEIRLDEWRQYTDVLNEEIDRERAALEGYREQLAAAAAAPEEIVIPGLDLLGERFGEFGANLQDLVVRGIIPSSEAILTLIDAAEARIAELEALQINPEDLDREEREEEKRRRQEERAAEKERRQEERTRALEEALETLGGTLRATRQRIEDWQEALDVLDDRLRRGAISQEQYNQAVGEFFDEATLSFADQLVGFAERYYGDAIVNEQDRIALEQLRWAIELENLRAQYEFLRANGRLTDEQVTRFDEMFAHFANFDPDWPALFGGDLFEEELPVERFLRRLSDAASDPRFAAQSGLLGIFDRILSMMDPESTVTLPRITGWREVTRGARPGEVPDEDLMTDRGVVTILEPIYDLLGEEMTVAEARFELARQMNLLELDVIEAQLAAAGALDPTAQGLIDASRTFLENAQYAGDAIREGGESFASKMQQFANQQDAFLSDWDAMFGVLGDGEDEDVEAVLREGFAALRLQFFLLNESFRMSFLAGLGLSPAELAGAQGNLAEQIRLLAAYFEENLPALIAATEGGGVEDQIRDFFDELRFGPSNAPAPRYQATLEGFREAIAAGDQDRALELGRLLLTGGVGAAHLGGATEAFAALRDEIVRGLGGYLPEGPPADLLLEAQQVTNDRLMAVSADITASAGRQIAAWEAGVDRIVEAIRELKDSVVGSLSLSPALAGRFS